MRVILTGVFVDDQDKALKFYKEDARLCVKA